MIVGVDYASVDANASPDFKAFAMACAAHGSQARFAIFRAAWGSLPDPTVQRDWRRARDAGLTCGAYLFLRMPSSSYTGSPEEQVHTLASVTGLLTDADLVPTIDVEATGLPPEKELAWIKRAWDTVVSIYGVAPMIYTSARVWREDLGDMDAGEMTNSPLWLAKPWPWAVRTPAQLGTLPPQYDPAVPPPWGADNWWFHQYQGDAFPVPGFARTVDLSRFHAMAAGARGERVKWVQRRVNATVDGIYGPKTDAAVARFQAAHNLQADGIVGLDTFTRLCWTKPNPSA